MDHFNLRTTEMRADAFTGSTALDAGIWLKLMLYCVATENRGRIEGCLWWTNKLWLKTIGLDEDELPTHDSGLWTWDEQTLVLWGFPHHHQNQIEAGKAQGHHGSKGGRPRKTPLQTPAQTPPETPKGKVREEKGKVREEKLLSAPDGAGPTADPAGSSDAFALTPDPDDGSGHEKKEGPPLAWSQETGWQGFTDGLWDELARAYPACDIRRQMLAMEQWLKANPAKARKQNWRRFVTNWLAKEQDRGGDMRGLPAPAWAGLAAKKETPPRELEQPPEGWEDAMTALWGAEWSALYAAWHPMPHSDKVKVRAWLAEHGKEAA